MSNQARLAKEDRARRLRARLESFARLYLWVWLLAFGGLVSILGALYFSGQWASDVNSRVTQFGICTDNRQLEFIHRVDMSRDRFYVCGKIEGTAYRSGSLAIMFNGRSIHSENFWRQPGVFFVPVDITDRFPAGEYVAELAASRKTLASAQFTIISD